MKEKHLEKLTQEKGTEKDKVRCRHDVNRMNMPTGHLQMQAVGGL